MWAWLRESALLLQLLLVGYFGVNFGNILNYMSYFHLIVLFFFNPSSAPKATAVMKEWRQEQSPKQTCSLKTEELGLFLSLGFCWLLRNETERGCDRSFKMKYVICICGRIGYKWNLHMMWYVSVEISACREVARHWFWASRSYVSHMATFLPPSSAYSWAAAISSSWNAFLPFSSLSTSHS